MECNKYQDGLIYTIKTDNGLYVGSTCDFAVRKRCHKSSIYNEKNPKYKYKLYQNIRENGGEYSIEIYKMFPCNNEKELFMEEEKVRKYLNPNLNTNKCFTTKEELKNYMRDYSKEYRGKNKRNLKEMSREYYQINKEIISQKRSEIITCECGCQTSRRNISTHRKSKKHLNLMKLKNF